VTRTRSTPSDRNCIIVATGFDRSIVSSCTIASCVLDATAEEVLTATKIAARPKLRSGRGIAET
jgi:hypothetical protein